MKKSKNIFVYLLIMLLYSSCVDLKHVNSFSSASLKSIEAYEDLDYNFQLSCIDNCKDKKIKELSLEQKACDCKDNEKADSVTLLIYNAVKGYFDGLTKISNNELTNYKMDALTKALTEGKFGDISIEKTHVEAFSNISKILLKAFTDTYRKQKIKTYVVNSNESLIVLLKYLDFNLSDNLFGKLNVQKERIKSYYFDLTKDSTLSTYEKTRAIEEYYQQLSKIEVKQKEILAYSKAIKKISEGHQKIASNADKMSNKDIVELLTQYSSDIQDIISEIKKFKK